jgi:predicted transcriptional regulator
VILLSIHPRFAHAILRGEKRFEFRKRNVPPARFVVLYATSPERKIVGFFEVKRTHKKPPQSLWSSFGRKGAICEDEFFGYYKEAEEGVAFEIGQIWSLRRPLTLASISTHSAPQSFKYVNQNAWARVQASARPILL